MTTNTPPMTAGAHSQPTGSNIPNPRIVSLYVMCGVAFSGKSTLARKIAERTGSTIIAFDHVWAEKDKEQPIPKGDKGWKFVRKMALEMIAKELQEGNSVIYDDTNVRFEHREELRKIARRCGARAIVVYLNTPIKTIREREAANRVTGHRHEVEPENALTALHQLEIPDNQENVLEFQPGMDLHDWLQVVATPQLDTTRD